MTSCGPFLRVARLVAVLMVLIGAVTANAAPVKSITIDYPPYSYRQDGELKGINVDLVREICRRIGLGIDIDIYPWLRGIKMLKHGEVDAVFNPIRTPERESWLAFGEEPLITEKYFLFIRKENLNTGMASLEELNGITVAVPAGFEIGARLGSAFSEGRLNKSEMDGVDNIVSAVYAGRVGAGVFDIRVAKWSARARHIETKLTFLSPMIEAFPTYFALSRSSDRQDILPQIDTALRDMKMDGTYQAILKKYDFEEREAPIR